MHGCHFCCTIVTESSTKIAEVEWYVPLYVAVDKCGR